METGTDNTEATAQEAADGDTTDWKSKSREWERRAKDNKAAADELATLKDSQKTAEQRSNDRVSEMGKRGAGAECRAAGARIA